LSVVRYTPLRPFVERVNDSGELGSLRPPPKPDADIDREGGDAAGGVQRSPDSQSASDAVPGGGAD
jgi:probable phosphoglycerate mutase